MLKKTHLKAYDFTYFGNEENDESVMKKDNPKKYFQREWNKLKNRKYSIHK